MSKALLLAIIVAIVVIPMRAAHDPRAPAGVRRAALQFAAFVVVWAYSLLHLLPALK